MADERKVLKKFQNQAAFTLVEIVIAVGLFTVVAISAYGSFRGGFMAYQRIEAQLGSDHEFKMFVRELTQELRNSFEFVLVPFEGKSDGIRFPSRVWRYEKDAFREDLSDVSYRCQAGKIVRKEIRLRKGFNEKTETIEELLSVDTCRFQFAYVKDGVIEWTNEWSRSSYLGLPRGIQLVLSLTQKSKKPVEKTIHFLIPQGILGTAQ